MSPLTSSSKQKRESRKDHVQINVTADSTPSGSRDPSPARSLTSKLFRVTPPDSNTFELRSPSSAAVRRTTTPVATPTLPPPRATRRTDGGRTVSKGLLRTTAKATERLGRSIIDSLWVRDEPRSRAATPRTRLHGDDDLPSTSHSTSHPSRILSRFGQLVVVILFLLGVREIFGAGSERGEDDSRRRPVRIKGRNPFSVLKDLQPSTSPLYSTSIPSLSLDSYRESDSYLPAPSALEETEEGGGHGDVTAVLLHWKRTENLKVIVASLCRYDFIDTVVVWNNNPDIALTVETFSASRCPSSKLQVYNSPRNLLFLARHLACTQANTPYCFFQDDDWFVYPIRSLYAQFKRDPEGSVVVGTTKEMAIKYRSEWCFFQEPLHACFAWLGTGAFTSRVHVANYLEAVSTIDFPRDELAHADNSFTTFLNRPPYVVSSGSIVEMKSGRGYSDGRNGDLRNQEYIQKGLQRFEQYLNVSLSKLPSTAPLPVAPISIDTASYRTPSSLPLPPHPYAQHVRASCVPSDLCFFLTNLPLLLPPDATPYPGPNRVKSLAEWEEHVRLIGHAESEWSLKWGYENAVDGNPRTAFRSLDVAKSQDYVGLGLIKPLDPIWNPSVVLHFIIEDVEQFLSRLRVEVSFDGYDWSSITGSSERTKKPSISCATSNLRSTRPDVSFPNTTMLSPSGISRRRDDLQARVSKLGGWWEKRKRRRVRLRECRVEISSVLELETGQAGGWRFVRLVVDRGEALSTGWGVYQLWIKASKLGI